jgi:NAD(P) transhydrogenase
MRNYELLIVGTGPAGVQAALRAARDGRKTAVIERRKMIGGVCVHTGTIPSKTLRQAVVDLSGYRTRGLYETAPAERPRIEMDLLRRRVYRVIEAEVGFQENLLNSRGVDVIQGNARFVDPHTVRVSGENGDEDVRGERILVAVGTTPMHPGNVPFDGRSVLDSDQLLDMERLPRSMIIVGGGVIGSEYASILSLLDVDVTLVNRTPRLLPFVDEDLVAELEKEMTGRGVVIHGDAEVEAYEAAREGHGARVTLRGGEVLEADTVLFCAGRRSAADSIDPAAAGLTCDARGQLAVDEDFRTCVSHIHAAGDVIGFPSLASASREQGRVAACRALGIPCSPVTDLLPFGIYTVPEMAMVGPTEKEAARESTVISGIGRYEETARGQIIGDTRGLLKIVVDVPSRRLLAAHLIGTGAAELVHLAQTAIACGVPYTYFVRTVMNYPTLSRVYKLAAWDVLEKLGD